MNTFTTLIAILFSTHCFASMFPATFDSMTLGRMDYNITHPQFPNKGQPWEWIKTQILIEKNEDGTYGLYKANTLPNRGGRGPVGPLSKEMTCMIDEQIASSFSILICVKDESDADGRIDSVIIQKNADHTLSVKYVWRNTKVISNKGEKEVVSGLGLEQISEEGQTLKFFPGIVEYKN